jgi:hypothetical protein
VKEDFAVWNKFYDGTPSLLLALSYVKRYACDCFRCMVFAVFKMVTYLTGYIKHGHGGGERRAQGFGGEAGGNETIGETQT